MLEFRQLALEDKELLAQALQGQEYENSELSFANLFIWSRGWRMQICEREGVLFFIFRDPASKSVGHMQPVVPLGRPVRPAVEMALEDLSRRQGALDISSVNDAFMARLRQEDMTGLVIEEDRDMAEYIYLRDDLVNLKGRKFHSKRNHINRFLNDFGNDYQWQPLGPEMLDQCLELCSLWMQGKEDNGNDADVDESEMSAIRGALLHMEALGLFGAMLSVGGKPCGFTVGENFRPDMGLIHLEKADPTVTGSYAFINQQFAEHNFEGVTFLNREEDMGIPGLRRAKESYNPVRLVNKYRIRRV